MFSGEWRRGEFSRGTLQSKGPIEEENLQTNIYFPIFSQCTLENFSSDIILEDGRILQDYG